MSVRRPLGDATIRANNAQRTPRFPTPQRRASPTLPHHESLKPTGNLTVRNAPDQAMSNVGNPRLSAVATEHQHNSNRNSQISTTSTNASATSRRKTHVGPWQLGATLGRGATARVRKARHAVTGQSAAIKIVSKAAAASVQRRTSMKGKGLVDEDADGLRQMPFGIEREVVIMKLIEHPNVIRLYDIWENRGELYLVLEYVKGGELFDYLVQAGHFQESEAVKYFRQILAGLTYCHHFNICHRDLKPENILMDRDKNIKLADFGMAALQPSNNLLNTSCGSPNYAAPEILEGKQYHGSDVDIWSCGIVLYAMLVGRTPFDDVDVPSILRNIKAGRFDMPSYLSAEAQDLLSSMLQVNPTHRITMDRIWRHPLVKKYDIVYAPDGTLQRNVGSPPMPVMDDAGQPIRRRADIDGEILRNLQTLWHGEPEHVVVQRLLDEKPNQEKFFYYLLLKYREKHLEDYPGPSLEYSASDYHHSKPVRRKRMSARQLHVPARGHDRKGSQFSILSDGQLVARARPSYYEEPETAETIESYDPFRSSRLPVHDAEAKYANITLLRRPSASSRDRAGSVHHPVISRLNHRHHSTSRSSIASSTRLQTPKRDGSMVGRESRSSLASSARRSSPIVIRPSDNRKRGVSFTHHRKPRGDDGTSPAREGAQSRSGQRSGKAWGRPKFNYAGEAAPSSSPSSDPNRIPRSRKNTTSNARPGSSAGKKSKTPSFLFKDEARQVSRELEKFCDESFNRSSVSSSARTTTTERLHTYDSPVSSFSFREDSPSRTVIARPSGASKNRPRFAPEDRPLPPTPIEFLDAYTEQQLTATRERLANRSAEGYAGASQGYLEDVIARLDRLIMPKKVLQAEQENGRRYASATADCTSPADAAHLPAISEERNADAEGLRILLDRGHHGYRTSSEPTTNTSRPVTRRGPKDEESTIRLIQSSPAPLTPVAPLNVRKRSSQQPAITVHTGPPWVGDAQQRTAEPQVDLIKEYVARQRNGTLHTIREVSSTGENSGVARTSAGESRLKGWFRRSAGLTRTSEAHNSLSGTDLNSPPAMVDPIEANGRPYSEVPVENVEHNAIYDKRKSNGNGNGRRGLFKIFSKLKSGDELPQLALSQFDFDDSVSVSSSSRSPSDLFLHDHETTLRPIQPQQNWFARILHIKPASRLLCFTMTKPRARHEVASIFRTWKKYGLRDVVVDKQRNVIFGRVDAQNFLRIKPVSFACEFFTVLDHGRRARLCIGRFTQEKGAASSFYKVFDTLETVLHSRDLLVDDDTKRRAMEKALRV